MDAIDISVIIPTCHRETQLLEAIGSVLGEPDVRFEIIVIDDGGERPARDAVSSIADPRVQYFARATPSRGRPALPRNDGARLARGRYLYFLDDDDLLIPGSLAAMSRALDTAPEAGMAFGAVEPFGEDQDVLRHEQRYFGKGRRIARGLRGRRGLAARLVFLPPIFVNSACMARRTAFLSVGGYDPDIPICEDAELWGRVVYATGFVFVDRLVVRYRTGAPSLMHALVEGDEKLRVSYRRIQDKYRQAHGLLNFLAMKSWTRLICRLTDPAPPRPDPGAGIGAGDT